MFADGSRSEDMDGRKPVSRKEGLRGFREAEPLRWSSGGYESQPSSASSLSIYREEVEVDNTYW